MRVLLTADLHLTDRTNDAYRFEFFRWLEEQKYDVLIILGDLTEEKDYHSSRLVNLVVNELVSIVESDKEIHVLMGNHDYSNPESPFFGFVSHLPNCHYHATPRIWEIGTARWAFFPHTKTPADYLERMQRGADLGVNFTLCHQLFSGAVSEHGRKLSGWNPGVLDQCGKVFAGDIHVPQVIGEVEYIGAPYPIHFGDAFQPRVVVVDKYRECLDLYPPYIKKLILTINDPEQIEYKPAWSAGDQVKVVMNLSRSSFHEWEGYRKQIQKICKRSGLVLCGIELKERTRPTLDNKPTKKIIQHISHAEQFKQFCAYAGVDKNDITFGEELISNG